MWQTGVQMCAVHTVLVVWLPLGSHRVQMPQQSMWQVWGSGDSRSTGQNCCRASELSLGIFVEATLGLRHLKRCYRNGQVLVFPETLGTKVIDNWMLQELLVVHSLELVETFILSRRYARNTCLPWEISTQRIPAVSACDDDNGCVVRRNKSSEESTCNGIPESKCWKWEISTYDIHTNLPTWSIADLFLTYFPTQ